MSPAALAGDAPRLDRWLAEHRRLHPGTDAKAAAALMLGGIAWDLGQVVAPAAVAARPSLLPCPDAARLLLAWASWDEDGVFEPAIAYRARLGGREAVPSPDALRLAFEATHAPLVASLARRTGLGRAALWRVVADSLSAALLEAGQEAGEPGWGMKLARATLGERASPLFNRQWGFFELEARRPDGRLVRDWFRARGGCCRFYTTEGGETCSTCVLRDLESRDERLRAWLSTRPEPDRPDPHASLETLSPASPDTEAARPAA